MEHELTLSIVVPTLDEEDALPALLASLSGEDGTGQGRDDADRADEILVVDGGSSDRTREVARRAGARVLRAPLGRGAQLARGAREARGELLLFLHADARLAVGSLAAVRAAFADPGLSASGMRQRVDAEGWFYRRVERVADWRVRHGWVYGDSGLCVRRTVYDAVGGFGDEPLFEDLDLTRRLRRHGRVELIEEAELAISSRRWKGEGAVRTSVRNWALTLAWFAGVAPQRLVRYYPCRAGRVVREEAAEPAETP